MARILIVDDTKNIRKMVRLTLEKEGHTVQLAEDGSEGLKYFGDGAKWDLMIVDQQMPGPQGSEVIVEARRRDPLARLMMMTAYATSDLASEVMTAGAADFLRKPFTTDVLRGAVASALARPRLAEVPEGVSPAFSGNKPVSFYWNGFNFWPVEATEGERQSVLNDNVYQVFLVRGPADETLRCMVLMTPHIETQVRAVSQDRDVKSKYLWEKVCRDSLIEFLWENATMPPALLPIYELSNQQLEDIRRLSVTDDEE